MKLSAVKERLKEHRLFAGEPAYDSPIVLNQRRIFILPSQRGLGFVVVLVLLLLIAFVYNNNLAYMLTFLLASVFFITILHSFKSLSGLSLQKGQTQAVFAGEAAGFTLHINNPGVRRHVQIALEATEYLTIPAYGKTSAVLYSTTYKRGWHQAGKVTVSSTYPLGLFRAWSPIRFDLKVLVYPKPAMQQSPFPETAELAAQQGFSKKGADDFYGLQSYQAGDSIKHIHWKAFAKGLGVFSKQYSGGSSADLWLDYDATQGHSTEERLSQLCRWVLDAEQAGVRYGFALPGFRLPIDSGSVHSGKCLEALALF